MSTHDTGAAQTEIAMGSERSFGIVFAVVFAVVGLWPLLDGAPARIWALVVAGAFLGLALVMPRTLKLLNLLWFKFGMLLHHVVTPVVMGLVFLLAVTPTGLIMRALGKDSMRLKRDPATTSYWIPRDPPGPAPDSMKHQF